jgi:hypothetical protein
MPPACRPTRGDAPFVSVGTHAIALIDVATFAVPIISLLLLKVREAAPVSTVAHWRAKLVAGTRHIYRTLPLRQVVIAGAISTTAFRFAETITYAIASNGLHERPAFAGVLVAIQGVRAIIGGSTAASARLGSSRSDLSLPRRVPCPRPPLLAPVIMGVVLFG